MIPTQAVVKTPAKTAAHVDLMGAETTLTPTAPGQYTLDLTLDPIYLITVE